MAAEEKSRNVMMVEEGNIRNVVGVEEKNRHFYLAWWCWQEDNETRGGKLWNCGRTGKRRGG